MVKSRILNVLANSLKTKMAK